MKKQHLIIKGTIILTVTGLITRIIGFFYRIFLSQTIGAEGMGIYQLIFPVYAMGFSLTSAGIQTSISKMVAAKISLGEQKASRDILRCGLLLSILLAIGSAYLVIHHADFIAAQFLGEPDCAPLLKIMGPAIPFGAVHSCISGYYYGLKKANIPAISQLAEQIIRVAGVYLIYTLCVDKGIPITASIAVYGLLLGEAASMVFCVLAVTFSKRPPKSNQASGSSFSYFTTLVSLSLPLTLNRIFINLLQSIEAILIPGRLKVFGLGGSDALSIYGVLTGMSMPLILFPSAITNSVAVMLLPTVSEAQAAGRTSSIREIIENTIKYCMILGILCTGGFILYGNEIGQILFKSRLSGDFIVTLAWICPFLYLATTLNSILHGLGKMTISFFNNMAGLLIRIGFVYFCIPIYGIQGYLWGILISELIITLLSILVLNNYTRLTLPLGDWIVKPLAALALSIFASKALEQTIFQYFISIPILSVFLSGLVMCILYTLFLFYTGAIHIHSKK